mgnify:CR=1 FL=1
MKINGHRRYDYAPRHYDERKERLKARIEQFQKENEASTHDERLITLRDKISDNWIRGEEYKKSIVQSNLRIVIILAVILALVFFVFNGLEIGGTYIEQLKSK